MDEQQFASLVRELTPHVVEACRHHLPVHNIANNPATSRAHSIPNPRQALQNAFLPAACSNKPASSLKAQRKSTPREELRNAFCRKSKQFKYSQKGKVSSKAMDVILLPSHKWSKVVKGKLRANFHKDGLLIDKFRFEKHWSQQEVINALFSAFEGKLTTDSGEPITFCIKKPEGSILLQPRVAITEALDGLKMCEIFSQRTVYLSPDRDLKLPKMVTISSDDDSDSEIPLPTLHVQNDGETEAMLEDVDNASASSRRNEAKTVLEDVDNASTSSCLIGSLSPVQDLDEPKDKIDSLTDPVIMIREILGFEDSPSQVLYLSRDSLFEDNVAFFKKPTFDIRRPITVRFNSEMAIDAGGPLRENFRTLFSKLHSAELGLFYGTHSHNILPSNNQMMLYSGMYEVLGTMMSSAIVNGVPVAIPLHLSVIDYILDRPREEQYTHMTLEDVIDMDLQSFLKEILECENDKDLTKLVNCDLKPTHWLDNCGWPSAKVMSVSCKHDLVLCVMYHYIIGMRGSAISAMQKGMKCRDRFPLNTLSTKQLSSLLSPEPISKSKLLSLVDPSLKRFQELDSTAARFVVHLINDIDDKEANTIAIFATGADRMYMELKEITLQLNSYNKEETSPVGNTCSASILFPVSFSNYDTFKIHTLKIMKDAINYFGML